MNPQITCLQHKANCWQNVTITIDLPDRHNYSFTSTEKVSVPSVLSACSRKERTQLKQLCNFVLSETEWGKVSFCTLPFTHRTSCSHWETSMTKIKFWKTIFIYLYSAIHKANGRGVPQLSTRTIPMEWKNVITCE